MAFPQFSSTTRLRHMNYPENQARAAGNQWNKQEQVTTLHAATQFHDLSDESALRNQVQLEQPNNLIGNHRKDGLKNNNSYRGTEHTPSVATKITSKNMPNGYPTHIISRHLTTTTNSSLQQSNVQAIEIEVLESFTEFAAFLELQNPICPAEHVDTPEKLMNLLSWDVWDKQTIK